MLPPLALHVSAEGGHFKMVSNFITVMFLGCHWQNFIKCWSSSGKQLIRSCTVAFLEQAMPGKIPADNRKQPQNARTTDLYR